MQEVVKTIRSIKQDYLHPKDRPEGWFTILYSTGNRKLARFDS